MVRRGIPIVAAVIAAALIVPPTGRADQPSGPTEATVVLPAAPRDVAVQVDENGVVVSWESAGQGTPRTSHYIVDAGPGTCAVTVPASARSVELPVAEGSRRITPRVRSVNAYGISAPVSAGRAFTVEGLADPQVEVLQVLGFTDFHGALEADARSAGAARLATAFARDREAVPATVTVSAGDNFGNSPLVSDLFEEYPTIEALNLMGLDVSTFGNHEHDRPLAHVRSMVEASDFTWTVANYSDLAAVNGPTKAVQPYVLLDRGGITVGIVGMNRARTVESVPPANFEFGDGDTLRISPWTFEVVREANRARAAGADVVILLVHDGWSANANGRATGPLVTISNRVAGSFDLIFGGHTHNEFASIIGGALVVQTPAYGQMYSRSQVCIDTRRGTVIGAVNDNVTRSMLNRVPPDPDVAAMVARYAGLRDAELTKVVGTISGQLEQGGVPAVERSRDFALGNFTADLLRREYGTELVLINAGIFREGLPSRSYVPLDPTLRRPREGYSGPYDITLGDLTAAYRFSKNVVTTTITGGDLWRAVERALLDYPRNSDFLQVSGMRIEFDPARPPRDRVTGLWRADGTPILEDERVYSVATLGYMVYGKFRYARLFIREGTVVRRPYLTTVTEAFSADRAVGRITVIPPAEGRIAPAAPPAA